MLDTRANSEHRNQIRSLAEAIDRVAEEKVSRRSSVGEEKKPIEEEFHPSNEQWEETILVDDDDVLENILRRDSIDIRRENKRIDDREEDEENILHSSIHSKEIHSHALDETKTTLSLLISVARLEQIQLSLRQRPKN